MASVTGRRLGSVAVARWFTEGLYRPGGTGTGVLTQGRHFSVRFDADQDEVSDTIDSHLDKSKDAPVQTQPLTLRREALSLYRDVLRYSRLFVWKDEKGNEWGETIRKSARQEFEASVFEKDPELLNRMLLMGRESVEEVKRKFLNKRQQIIEEESNTPPEHRGGPPRV
eukprot:CAMPEP_0177763722 /NCGR_PEP_ID=MMETSP0491_2-20121128/7018_1 /TAXON_ID=63592 /ORGANISM="Tetraselmis chuii, Strain PLY429" /LENGTH=168 /DNA_ID=CAMNT_0019279839 /DNA_START=186 /DNA_END=692 /DNA_ORIENTATION=-